MINGICYCFKKLFMSTHFFKNHFFGTQGLMPVNFGKIRTFVLWRTGEKMVLQMNRIRKYSLFYKIFLILDFWKYWSTSKNVFLMSNRAAVGTLICFILTRSRSHTSAPQISIVHSYKKYSCFYKYYIVIIHIVLVNKCTKKSTLIFC